MCDERERRGEREKEREREREREREILAGFLLSWFRGHTDLNADIDTCVSQKKKIKKMQMLINL